MVDDVPPQLLGGQKRKHGGKRETREGTALWGVKSSLTRARVSS